MSKNNPAEPAAGYPLSILYRFRGEERTVHIRDRISFISFGAAVENAAASLYIEGRYIPYLKPYVLASTVIENYTDYDGSYDPDDLMELVETTDFYRILTKSISKTQYVQLEDAIEEAIAYRNTHSETEAFFRDLRALLSDWEQHPERAAGLLHSVSGTGAAETTPENAPSAS